MVNIISPATLKAKLDDSHAAAVLLDVREPGEYQICHIDSSVHIPMGEIPNRLQELDEDQEIIVICHHGMRSMQVAMYLESHGFPNVSNLQGGIDAWAVDVDPKMSRY